MLPKSNSTKEKLCKHDSGVSIEPTSHVLTLHDGDNIGYVYEIVCQLHPIQVLIKREAFEF